MSPAPEKDRTCRQKQFISKSEKIEQDSPCSVPFCARTSAGVSGNQKTKRKMRLVPVRKSRAGRICIRADTGCLRDRISFYRRDFCPGQYCTGDNKYRSFAIVLENRGCPVLPQALFPSRKAFMAVYIVHSADGIICKKLLLFFQNQLQYRRFGH